MTAFVEAGGFPFRQRCFFMFKTSLADPGSSVPYLIGELAYNHEGDFAFAKKMIGDLGTVEGISAVKFHMLLDIDSYISPSHPDYSNRQKWIWTEDQYLGCLDLILACGKEAIVLADDARSIELCVRDGRVAGIELHSVCLNDRELLEALSRFDGAVMLGIGGTELSEIEAAVEYLQQRGIDRPILMHGVQNYPTELETVQLQRMAEFGNYFHLEVGYADHTAWDHPDNAWISTLAYTRGFRILEKHYSPVPGTRRIDYEAAIGLDQFRDLVRRLEIIRQTLGNGCWELSGAERRYGAVGLMKKTVVAKRDLPAGQILTDECLAMKRVGQPADIRQSEFAVVLGKKLTRPVLKNEPIIYRCIESL